MITALLIAALVTSLAVGLMEMSEFAGYSPIPDAASSLRTLVWIYAGTFVTAFLTRLIRVPSMRNLAAVADRRFGLHDRLSTLLELTQRPSSSLTLVERAAIEDAIPHAAALRPSAIVPLVWPRWAWAVPVLAASTAALGLLETPTTMLMPTDTPAAQELVLAPVTAAAVRQVADALARNPEALKDPYLTAVAREFQAFAERLEGRETVEGEMASELDQLLEHLVRATDAREDSVGQALHALATARLRSPKVPTPDRAAPETTPTDGLSGSTDSLDPASSNADLREDGPSIDDLLADLADAVAASEVRSTVRQPGEAAVDCDSETLLYAGVCVERSEVRNTPSGLVQQGDAAGNPVGGAELSDDRAGDAAGGGGQPDDAATEAESGPVDGDAESVMLPDAAATAVEGPRYEVEGIPSDEDRSATAIDDMGPLASHRIEEGAMSQQSSGRAYDDVVRRYFLPVPPDGVRSPAAREVMRP